tara:strand:- start:43 stop:1149 length:1107 start_codon:yes stop_codon:yes gene_type:complete
MFNDEDKFTIGKNYGAIRAQHHFRRMDWVGHEGKTYKEICSPPSEYLDQPGDHSTDTHLKYDLSKDFLRIKTNFPLKIGEKIKRKKIHDLFGGQREGGISTPKVHKDMIFIFSDPKEGEKYGYHDGWDGSSFYYFGEGQLGDMEFVKGNKAILNHKENGKNIFLFSGSGGHVTYENQFTLDEEKPYTYRDSKDRKLQERQAIVFKLNPVSNYKTNLPKTNIDNSSNIITKVLSQEAFETEISERLQEEKIIISQRKESKLVKEYQQYREKNNQSELVRISIKIDGRTHYTDGWCPNEKLLIEAKSSAARPYIRLAIGQLLDYKRHIDPDPKKLAILVPTKPQEDLLNLLSDLEIILIYKKDKDTFISI